MIDRFLELIKELNNGEFSNREEFFELLVRNKSITIEILEANNEAIIKAISNIGKYYLNNPEINQVEEDPMSEPFYNEDEAEETIKNEIIIENILELADIIIREAAMYPDISISNDLQRRFNYEYQALIENGILEESDDGLKSLSTLLSDEGVDCISKAIQEF
jgi:ribosomal protein L11 methylase PrmA